MSSIKNKNLLVIVFEMLVIVLGVVGITFAAKKIINDRTSTIIKAGEYGLDYVGDKVIAISDIEPISDDVINIDTTDNVIRTEFKVKGIKSNNDDNLIYDVMFNDMKIDCALLNKYVKWNLYKNGELISNGNLDPAFDGAVLTDSMHLTNIQESLPKYNEEYDSYVLIFWISETCDNLETCDLIDQSSIVGDNLSMNIFIALLSGEKQEYVRVPNYDNSCANKPELADNMIGVTYADGQWQVADISNSDRTKLWYSYNEAKWANSVITTNSEKYKEVGTAIDNNDVLAWYVWIPRFRYKLWNVNGDLTDSYNAYDNGINIIFENGNTQVNGKNNNEYLTHPAFGEGYRGFWISKYEVSKDNNIYKSVPNTESYRKDTVDNYKNIAKDLGDSYKLPSENNIHMINNLEWGATVYLSHSKYGLCAGDGCLAIGNNESYVSANNKQDTTTRNVYGVYDMAGGSGEYVLGYYKIGSATSEVMQKGNMAWNNTLSLLSDRDYIIRGGMERGLFYFGDMSMNPIENSTRYVLITK